MKTEYIATFIEETEYLLQKGRLERVLTNYIDFFSKDVNYADLLQRARVNLTQLNKYNLDNQAGLAPDEKIWNRITTSCWDIFQELCKKHNYHHKDSVFSKLIPRKGRIQHNIPAEMRIHDPEPCKVRVVLSKHITSNETSVGAVTGMTEEPVQILGEDGSIQIESVEENAFLIQMIPNIPVQKFLPKIYTEWTFYITPKVKGAHLLALNLVSDIKMPDGRTQQQVVYSLTKTIQVVDYPVALRSMGMVTEGRPYVWKFPGLKYWIMWLLVLLSQIWIPLVVVIPLVVIPPIIHNTEEWQIKPDKPLQNPVVTYRNKTVKGIPADHGVYKVKIEKDWKNSSGNLTIRDAQFTCLGYINAGKNIINCKCVKTPFSFIFKPDSLSPKSETLSITVDGDTLNPVIASRIRENCYAANFYISDRDKIHAFECKRENIKCLGYWHPGDVSNKVTFECGKVAEYGVNVTFKTEIPLIDRKLITPDQNKVTIFEQNEYFFRFSSLIPEPAPDSFFVTMNAMSDGKPCICEGAAKIKNINDDLLIHGKCRKTSVDVNIAVHLEFDVSHPKVSFLYPDEHKIIKPNFILNLDGTVLKFKLPKQSKRLRVLVGEGQGLQSVDLIPDKNKTVRAMSNSKKVTIQLSDYFKKYLSGEHFQIINTVSQTNKGRIDPGKGNVVFYEAKGKPQHWNIMWSTRGEGGTPANIKVAEIAVDKRGGHQKITCLPSWDLKKALGQPDSGKKGIDLIFPLQQ